jgi:hypothetical protein
VTRLLLAEAKKRKQAVEVVEWPGSDPIHVGIELPSKEFKAVLACKKKANLPGSADFKFLAGIGWMSDATFKCGDEEVHRLVGPACCGPKAWFLQIMGWPEEELSLEDYKKSAEKIRKHMGFNAVKR